MQKPAKQALTFWLSAAALILLALFTWLGRPHTPDGAGEAIGRVLTQTGVPALLVWWLARRRNPLWSWLQFGSAYLLAVIAFALLTTVGRARAEEPFPFEATFAQAWTVERLAGVSSAPQDQAAGVRQRVRLNGADGAAVIEIACSWLRPNDHPDVRVQLRGVVKGMSDGLSKQDMVLDEGTTSALSKGHRQWLQVNLRAHDASGTRFMQTIAMTSTESCLATVTLTGTPQAHALQSPEFASVLDHLQFHSTSSTQPPAAN
ncbi:MAG: hypothetical protein ABIR10_10800 [Dokdonella sp.]